MSLKRAAPAPIKRTWNEQRNKEIIKQMRSEPWTDNSAPSVVLDHRMLMRSNDFWTCLITRSIEKAMRKGRVAEARTGMLLKENDSMEWGRLPSDQVTCFKA